MFFAKVIVKDVIFEKKEEKKNENFSNLNKMRNDRPPCNQINKTNSNILT